MTHGLASTPAWYLGAPPSTVTAWISRFHWIRCAVDAVVLTLALVVPDDDFPLRRLAAFIAATLAVHALLAWRISRGQRIPPFFYAGALVLDVALLTGLLELSGGPSNPFAVIYALQIFLAAVTLGPVWTIAVATFAVGGFGLLIAWHLEELVPDHHRLIDFPTHLFTMWLAVTVIAEVILHFIRESSVAIARREAQLTEMRDQAARRERLISLTTLAAGAAHELSTPLGTIAVAAHELERALQDAAANSAWAADVALIRQQVSHCQVILDQMGDRAGHTAANVLEPTDLQTLVTDVRARLSPEQAARFQVSLRPSGTPLLVPRAGLVQVVLSLVKNGFDASRADQPVLLEGADDRQTLRLVVQDRGAGMTADVLKRAGEPFYTTKEPGSGLGLGLFLARMFAERLGGSLTIGSDPGATGSHGGTTATLELPVRAAELEGVS